MNRNTIRTKKKLFQAIPSPTFLFIYYLGKSLYAIKIWISLFVNMNYFCTNLDVKLD